jgi:hypothetical protein
MADGVNYFRGVLTFLWLVLLILFPLRLLQVV